MSEYMIETRDLTKKYGTQSSVSHLDIHVKKGRIYGLLGRNGAGKTTTMRMLLGLTAPTSGEVKIFGKPFAGNEKDILPRIGCLIESPGFYPNLTGMENLKIFADLRGLRSPKYIKSALELVNLPYRDKKLFSQYSLGMKQRLAIALAVMHNPELLILDEPINGLDPIGIAEVRDFIRELCDAMGKTILISSHILSEISLLADDVGIIDHGNLLEEESLKELEEKNAKYIHFCVSNAQKAAQVIASSFGSKNVSFVVFAALLFPIPFTALVLAGSVGNFTGFEAVFGLLVTMGMPIMLPAALGIIGAMLFFMERDHDTLKNLRVLPVSPLKIVTAKIAVLYILGLVFALATMLSSMAGGLIAGSELSNMGENIGIAVITALLYTTSILPVVIAIVGFNRSYIFSIILTFFYTMFDYMLAYGGMFATTDPVMKLLTNIMPAPIIYRWQASMFAEAGTAAYTAMEPYFLPLWIVILTVAVIGGLSYLAIVRIYSRRES